jgi:hypothetical protein
MMPDEFSNQPASVIAGTVNNKKDWMLATCYQLLQKDKMITEKCCTLTTGRRSRLQPGRPAAR